MESGTPLHKMYVASFKVPLPHWVFETKDIGK